MAPCFYVQHFFLQQHKRKRVARTVFLSASYQRIQIKTRQRTLCKQINSRWTCPKGAQCKRRKTASKQSPVSAISTIVSLKGWKRKELKENINKERKEKKTVCEDKSCGKWKPENWQEPTCCMCCLYWKKGKKKKKADVWAQRERVNLAKEKKKNMVTRKCQSSSSDRAQSEWVDTILLLDWRETRERADADVQK